MCWQLERQIAALEMMITGLVEGKIIAEISVICFSIMKDSFPLDVALCLLESLKGFVTIEGASKSFLIFWEIGMVYLQNEQVDFNQTGLTDVRYSF